MNNAINFYRYDKISIVHRLQSDNKNIHIKHCFKQTRSAIREEVLNNAN